VTIAPSFFREILMMLRSHIPAAARRPYSRRTFTARSLVLLTIFAGLSSGSRAAETDSPQPTEHQTRNFSILIDGTRRGKSTTQFRSGNGTVWTHSEGEIRINYLVYRYNYSSTGTEVWKDGRLTEVDNTADYNGTQYVVKGAATSNGLQITTNGATSLVSPEIWDTSYAFLPERLARADGVRVLLLDSDQGRRLIGKLQFIGEEKVTAANTEMPCSHYLITGDVHVDLWFDGSRRLVRQVSKESGHKVRFELLSVTAE
jgi:hypothetical protein